MTLDHNTEYAGFWRRLVAVALDALLLLPFAGLALYLAADGDIGSQLRAGDPFALYDPSVYLAIELGLMTIVVTLWVRFMGTPGKLLLGCLIVDARSGQPLRVGRAMLRYVAYLLSALPLMAGFLWIAIDHRKQGLHDKIAGSVVVIEDDSSKSLDELQQALR